MTKERLSLDEMELERIGKSQYAARTYCTSYSINRCKERGEFVRCFMEDTCDCCPHYVARPINAGDTNGNQGG